MTGFHPPLVVFFLFFGAVGGFYKIGARGAFSQMITGYVVEPTYLKKYARQIGFFSSQNFGLKIS